MYWQSPELLILTQLRLKCKSLNPYRCVSHSPSTRHRFQNLSLSLFNPLLFLSNSELFSKCSSYVHDNCTWLHSHSWVVIVAGCFNKVWCDTLHCLPPCWLTLKVNTCRFLMLTTRYSTAELSEKCKASLDTYKRFYCHFIIYLQHI